MPIYKWLFVVVFVTINCHFLFSQCNENIFDSFEMSEIEFDDWENKNKKTKIHYYHGSAGPKADPNDPLIVNEAYLDLARRISVNILAELEAKFEEENFVVIKNNIKDNLEVSIQAELLNTKNIRVRNKQGFTIHSFKCKEEYLSEKKQRNSNLRANAQRNFVRYRIR